jgi:diguanylate cyclase (GGDEF)-like protein
MPQSLSLLLVEDSEDDELLLLICLRKAGFEPIHQRVETGPAMAAALDARPWDLVISDHNMPSFSAPAALKLLRDKGFDLPFIIVSGSIGEEAAVSAMKAGAQDYLLKGNLARLPAAIERELKDAAERRARRDAEEKIRFLAYFDPLTALPNRAHFCEQLGQRVREAQRTGSTLGVVSFKLDDLREINNTLGYVTGERVLVELTQRLRRALGASELLGRIGGAEFAVVLDGELADVRRTTEHLQGAIAGTVRIDALELEPATSFGIAMYPVDADNAELLLQRTNVALSQAADSPRRVVIYDADRDPFQPQRLALISDLRRAIASEQLRLHYQPKVHFSTGTLMGVEALVRWNHPTLGMLRPDLFISLAEQTGLINPLTRWVLKEAMAQSAAWSRAGLDLSVAINFSAKNLQNPELAEHLGQRLLDAPSTTSLIVEVTESAIMSDESRAQEILRKLQQQGVAIAIDDFGTGYSSFARLRDQPIDEIKIDKSFVSGMLGRKEDHIIVASIIDLGHKLGLQVVAEGVETAASWDELANLQCDLAQGYLLSRPLAPDAVLPWFRSFVAPPVTYPPDSDLRLVAPTARGPSRM